MTLTGPAMPSWNRRLGFGLLLTSLSLLALELILVRIYSVLMWYHFVSLIVALALFGLTVSGLVVFLWPDRFPAPRAEEWMGRASLLLALSILAAWGVFFFLGHSPLWAYRVLATFHQPFYEPFGTTRAAGFLSWSLIAPLAALCLFTALPFFLGGFVATLAIWRFSGSIARVYFFDLAGAGLGCLTMVALLAFLDPFSALAVLAAVAAVAALLFFWRRGSPLWRGAAAVALAGSIAVGLASVGGSPVELNFIRGRYEPGIVWRGWNSFSRVVVYPLRRGQIEGSWGMSRNFRGRMPEQLGLVVDDTGYSTITGYRPGDDLSWARANLLALPYSIRRDPEALIIGPGVGKDILVARAMSEGSIRAVEINPLIVRAVQEEFADFSGKPYTLPGVEVVIDEGRNFLRRDTSHYDIIQAAVVYGRLAPAAGAFTLTEDHLYTIEAFHDYLNRLKPDGILAVSRFRFEKRILRLVATARQVLEERGSPVPGRHLFIAAERGLATVLLKLRPFSKEEVAALERRCRDLGFQIVYSPARPADDPSGFEGLLASPDASEFYRTLDYDISPVSDDRPFFYYLVRPRDFLRLSGAAAAPDFDDRAIILIRNLLAVILLLMLIFILGPLLRGGRAREVRWSRAWPAMFYFACLGLGFAVVEISLLKRFMLLLGRPVYSVAVVLSVLLVAAGVGSYRSQRRAGTAVALRKKCAALAALLLLVAVMLPAILELALPLSLTARLLVTVLVVAPLGYLMGQPFPLGVSLVREQGQQLIPWVWSINGILAVLGSILTLVLALNLGYTTTMLLGPATYLAAAVMSEKL